MLREEGGHIETAQTSLIASNGYELVNIPGGWDRTWYSATSVDIARGKRPRPVNMPDINRINTNLERNILSSIQYLIVMGIASLKNTFRRNLSEQLDTFHRFGKKFTWSFYSAICKALCYSFALKRTSWLFRGISLMFIRSTDSGRSSESLVVSELVVLKCAISGERREYGRVKLIRF